MIVSPNKNTHTQLLHSLYLSGRLNCDEIVSYLSSYQADTYKADGFIKVSNKELAINILKQHFKDINKEYEIDYYPEETIQGKTFGFIQDNEQFCGSFYLGKFELCLSSFLIKLHNNGIIIEDFLIERNYSNFF